MLIKSACFWLFCASYCYLFEERAVLKFKMAHSAKSSIGS